MKKKEKPANTDFEPVPQGAEPQQSNERRASTRTRTAHCCNGGFEMELQRRGTREDVRGLFPDVSWQVCV
jgi:hypothetical protein